MGALTLAVLLGLPTPRAGAAGFSRAKDNIEGSIRAYVERNSPDGYWAVQPSGRGAPLRLKLKSVDQKTIQELKSDLFSAVAAFSDEKSRMPYFGEFQVAIVGGDWEVAGMRWLTRASLPPGTPALPAVALPAVGSMKLVLLDSCSTRKCLTVYVAPWCPHCRNATANILKLKAFLKGKGIDTRIVVGDDSEGEVAQYAQSIGKGTLMDSEKAFKFAGGVPHLFVSEDGGRILREMAGFYEDAMRPEDMAAALGLP